MDKALETIIKHIYIYIYIYIYIAGRTEHEYYIDNKDSLLQYSKVRYVTHRSHILERVKTYSENNKEHIKTYNGDK